MHQNVMVCKKTLIVSDKWSVNLMEVIDKCPKYPKNMNKVR